MPTLTLKLKDRVLGDYPINQGNILTIGRRTSNDVVIVNLSVSGYHADITPSDKGFILNDLDSKNGTLVNGRQVSSIVLSNGDIITIGKHILVFEENDDTPLDEDQEESTDTIAFENPNEIVDKTMIIDTTKIPGSLLGKTMDSSSTGVISLLNKGKRVELNKQFIRIGKNPGSDIVVKGLFKFLTGDTAATISKRPGGYYISYVAGILKPKVNNRPLKGTKKLKKFDKIRIGSLKLQFLLKKR